MFSSYGKVAIAASWLLLRITVAEAAPNPSPQADADNNSVGQLIPTATTTPAMNALVGVGCYSTPTPLIDHGPYTFQSKGNCQPICYQLQKPVMGLVNGTNCYCGDLIPPESTMVEDNFCSTTCGGIDTEFCGGDNYWTVYLTGITRNKIGNLDDAALSSSAGASTTRTAATVVVTASSKPSDGGGGTSKVGVAVGAVVGVIGAVGIAAGVFFFLRHKRRREAEEEYKRQAAVNAFVNGGKGHNSTPSLNDSRLDPDILQRRESTGTIADNQDYSRRILKVS